jgi:hypothetical protein
MIGGWVAKARRSFRPERPRGVRRTCPGTGSAVSAAKSGEGPGWLRVLASLAPRQRGRVVRPRMRAALGVAASAAVSVDGEPRPDGAPALDATALAGRPSLGIESRFSRIARRD